MGVPGNANALLLRSAAAAGGYQVSRSLRFNSSDSAYLSRTPASAGNRKTWTWAGWVKRSGLGTYQRLFDARNPGVAADYIRFNNNDTLEIYIGATLITSQVFRDPGSWYHLVVAVDTTQATASNRVKLYVNEAQVTTFGTANYPSQNADSVFNAALIHSIGTGNGTTEYFSGYLADIHFIDGQALTPSSFTEVSATTGQLVPKAYSGSYGTNGFKLTFSDNSNNTATTLGKDTSGNGNNFTPTNFSVAAGAGNDSLTDTPTSYGTDDSLGGSVRGNYCTLNPLASAGTMSNGNLDGYNAVNTTSHATFAMPSSGKWYFEGVMTSGNLLNLGLASYRPNGHIYSISNSVLYSSSGVKNVDGVNDLAYGASFTTGDVIGVACDADSGSVTFYKNGVSQGAITHQVGGLFPSFGNGGVAVNYTVNFGQRPWAYTPPANHRPLVDTCLPAPLVAKPSTVMDVIRYTGTGANATIPNVNTVPTSIDFTPDLVWIKGRSGATDHALYDSVRDVQKDLVSNSTAAETTQSTGLTAFGTNNFNIGTLAKLNTSSSTYAAWCWDAGTTTSSNVAGSITSSVRANTSAGFSVVTYVGTGATGGTVGHGLGVAPSLIIAKSRSASRDWAVYHKDLTKDKYLNLNSTAAASTTASVWGNAEPTSTVFGVYAWSTAQNNANGENMVAYCFAPVSGYSSFGSYTGNGSADGPFVYTGFRPRWVMVKASSSVSFGSWRIYDSARGAYNVIQQELYANLSSSEDASNTIIDFLSNGFKLRSGAIDGWNGNGATIIYAAFAENPFQYARAR